ncbi:hypothetical protein NEO96_10310 [Escherichia coli]|nr:hypothetical protein [Escherichia coli]
MSNIDKHAVQAVVDLKAGYTLGNADVAILNELARIALASLEAEPVAWLLSGGGAKNNVSFDSGNAYADPLREVTPLYTAHPAPVAPDEMTPQKASRSYGGEVRGYRDGWNACRAAMLQGADGNAPAHFRSRPAQSSLYPAQGGNSPVIPEGWVLVPVEPTEDMIVNGFESEPDESFSDEK